MMNNVAPDKILSDILSIKKSNAFLQYIVKRLRKNEYRGLHVSQHNRYDLHDIKNILEQIHSVCGTSYFAIPPGDYRSDSVLIGEFECFQIIVNHINSKIGRGTINSIKKNFFPDLEKMGFISRQKIKKKSHFVLYGKLTSDACEFISAQSLVDKYKKFTDGIDKLFGNRISELAEIIHTSDYAKDVIDIYEFMFIFSDESENIDKIKLLDSYRSLKAFQITKIIDLIKRYANPENFYGNKTSQKDFHNWKNQAQQIFNLLKTTVYFEVDSNHCFRLNIGNTGFFQQSAIRSSIPKKEYFKFHQVSKRNNFELHHIIPISQARNGKEAKMIDDYRNLIYIYRKTHKEISKNRNRTVVLTIDPQNATFTDFDHKTIITAQNQKDALYSIDSIKTGEIQKHNSSLLLSIFEYDTTHSTS